MLNIVFPDNLQELSLRAQEVVKEIDDRPHLLVRIEISGAYFPHRALEPFVKIVTSRGKAETSWFADVSDDNRRLAGYFPTDLPRQGTVEFGYGSAVLGRLRVKFESKAVTRLDRERLPEDVIEVSSKYLKARQQR